MNTGKSLIADDQIRVKLGLSRCGCADHLPVAFRYVLFVDEQLVYLASQCSRCGRIRLFYLADIDAFRLSGNPLDEVYEASASCYYAQSTLF